MTTPPVIAKVDKIFVRITDARDNVIEDVLNVRKIKGGRERGKNKQIDRIWPHQCEDHRQTPNALHARKQAY